MRILWRRNTCGLLDHSWPDKSDLRARLGDQDVAERREAGRNAAEGRVRQDGYERELLPVMYGSGGRNLGHLHQREHAFLHACSAAGCHAHQWNSALGSLFKGMSNFFPDDRTHRAAQKREIKNYQNRLMAADSAKSRGDSFADSGLPPGVLEANTVGFVVCKPERIDRNQLAVQLTK